MARISRVENGHIMSMNQPMPYPSPSYDWQSFDQPEPSKRTQYPIVTKLQQYGLSHEVVTDWNDVYARLAAIGWQRFDGDVWTIQLTARPGYYVTSEQINAYGLTGNSEFPPLG